nr:MAG TPA: UL2 protein [Caudoviricetes sp.]
MKTVTIYIVEDVTLDSFGKFAQSDTHCFFDADKARRQFDSRCIRDEMEQHGGRKYSIYMAAHTVRLPDDYEVTTADKLDEDLLNGDVESPDYVPFRDAYLNTSNEELKEI